MNHLPLIIKREYLTKVRNKSFIVMTILSPIIMIVLISVVAYLSELNNDKVRTITVLDASGLVKDVFENTNKTKYNFLENMSLNDAKKLVKETNSAGLLYVDKFETIEDISNHIKFYSEDSPSLTLISDLETKLENKLTNLKLQKEGIDLETIRASNVLINIAQESFEGEEISKIDNFAKLGFGIAAGYLLFMFIIIYGNMIMRSVIEEKTSRIIEIIISSVKPVQLLLGKIIGTSLVGLTQFIIWLVFGGLLMTVVSLVLGVNFSNSGIPQQEIMQMSSGGSDFNFYFESFRLALVSLPLMNLIVAFILFFICGYLLYSSLYAAIGAAVDSETDTQQFILPIIMPLMLAVYIGIFTVIEDPHGTISTVFSFIPFTSPVVMLMRIPFGVPLWQQLVSLFILIATFMFAVWFAAKIYRVGILMYGKKPTYKELIKWMKY
ncbi:ABC-2 type transport system permease protein [Mariniflexile fucanivorans]|uniref:ABC-2 type transport system permease protein n=1 Tax=Mariniflexile fucanivorans TaxID=264023 RepID=A0A4R1RJ22_9FLAO|nr:ABC transporter permease [Mariniflexile fucanivorans]TCL66128.1 ABC-2 type transport system permease protein [Mariniflexile fucanivorans]